MTSVTETTPAAATQAVISASGKGRMPRLPVLDGWRGISILVVLFSHMLPLGPNRYGMNLAFGYVGMAIFFTLSGFLITSTLYFHPSVRTFAIRRLCRILPLAWLYTAIALLVVHAGWHVWVAQMLFYSNLPPFWLTPLTGHLWSLCIEVQFYAGVGILFLLLRQRGLALLPLLCIAITLGRILTLDYASIVTLFRVDEILSGASLAFLFHSRYNEQLRRALAKIPPTIPFLLLLLASHPSFPVLNYLRPYFAAALVGTTLFHEGSNWNRVLESNFLRYIATISFALYIWHPLSMYGWFEPADKILRYERRILSIALTFAAAHLSTFYFESIWINLGKRLTAKKA